MARYMAEVSPLFKLCLPQTLPPNLPDFLNLEMATLVRPGPNVTPLNIQNRPRESSAPPPLLLAVASLEMLWLPQQPLKKSIA